MTGDTVQEKVKRGWDNSGVGAYAALAMLLAFACGFSWASYQAQKAMVGLAEQHRLERVSIIKANKVNVNYLRREIRKKNVIIEKQSDQLAQVGVKSADAAKQSSELGKQILKESTK